MKYWPVNSFKSASIPGPSEPGSFWEDRGDRRHAGIDLYAPAGSAVVAVEKGTVHEVSVFTSADLCSYWNTTYSLLLKSSAGYVWRYAELGSVVVQNGQTVEAGQPLGTVGTVLEIDSINRYSPAYIQALKQNGSPSMLHLELHTSIPVDTPQYLGGNYYLDQPPSTLLDPSLFLSQLLLDLETPYSTPEEEKVLLQEGEG